jgi:hypothetical protein
MLSLVFAYPSFILLHIVVQASGDFIVRVSCLYATVFNAISSDNNRATNSSAAISAHATREYAFEVKANLTQLRQSQGDGATNTAYVSYNEPKCTVEVLLINQTLWSKSRKYSRCVLSLPFEAVTANSDTNTYVDNSSTTNVSQSTSSLSSPQIAGIVAALVVSVLCGVMVSFSVAVRA